MRNVVLLLQAYYELCLGPEVLVRHRFVFFEPTNEFSEASCCFAIVRGWIPDDETTTSPSSI